MWAGKSMWSMSDETNGWRSSESLSPWVVSRHCNDHCLSGWSEDIALITAHRQSDNSMTQYQPLGHHHLACVWNGGDWPKERVMFHGNLPQTLCHLVTRQLELITDRWLIRLQITTHTINEPSLGKSM